VNAAETLRVYVAWLADKGRTIATVNAYVAAIASAHSIAKSLSIAAPSIGYR
jgi:hypothetical protein